MADDVPVSVAAVVPPIVTDLFTAVRALMPAEDAEDGVRVVVGPDTGKKFSTRSVTLAATWDERLDPVSVERVERGARPRVLETTTVACSVMVGGSERKFEEWRTSAGDQLALIDQALRVMAADDRQTRRGYTRWIDWNDDDGGNGAVLVDFVVEITTIS